MTYDATWVTARGVESAELRPDGRPRYRYWLERRWSSEPNHLLWVLFNPSRATADGTEDDPAVKACVRRTKRHAANYPDLAIGAMRMVNLFACRATNTRAERWPTGDGLEALEWRGPDNAEHLEQQTRDPGVAKIVVAWGPTLVSGLRAQNRASEVLAQLGETFCLGQEAKSGQPYYAGPRSRYSLGAPLYRFSHQL